MTATRKRRRVGGLRKRCEHRPEQWRKCSHAWHINFQWRGVHYRISLDRYLGKHIEAKTDAEDAAADIKKAIKAGKFGEQLPAKDVLTLEQLLSTYIKEYVTPVPRSRARRGGPPTIQAAGRQTPAAGRGSADPRYPRPRTCAPRTRELTRWALQPHSRKHAR
jgi:hypothetical protein